MEELTLRQLIENKMREMLERSDLTPQDIHELAAAYNEFTKDEWMKDVWSSLNQKDSMINSCITTVDSEIMKNTTS